MPKFLPKSVQTCFEVVLGWFFRENFLPSVPWRVESSKSFKKIKKVSKFQKCPKSSTKVSKRVLNMFWGNFSENFFAQCSMEGRVIENFQKIKKFQNSKNAQNRPQKCPNEIFQKQKKFQKSKHAQNCSQKCLNVFWRCFRVIFWKNVLPSVPWRVESSKIFKKIKKISKFQKCPKSFPKVSKRVLKIF